MTGLYTSQHGGVQFWFVWNIKESTASPGLWKVTGRFEDLPLLGACGPPSSPILKEYSLVLPVKALTNLGVGME